MYVTFFLFYYYYILLLTSLHSSSFFKDKILTRFIKWKKKKGAPFVRENSKVLMDNMKTIIKHRTKESINYNKKELGNNDDTTVKEDKKSSSSSSTTIAKTLKDTTSGGSDGDVAAADNNNNNNNVVLAPSKKVRSITKRGWECCASMVHLSRLIQEEKARQKNMEASHQKQKNNQTLTKQPRSPNQSPSNSTTSLTNSTSSSSSSNSYPLSMKDGRTSLNEYNNYDLLLPFMISTFSSSLSSTTISTASKVLNRTLLKEDATTTANENDENDENDENEMKLLIKKCSHQIEQIYTYYLYGINEMNMRNFGLLIKDANIIEKKKIKMAKNSKLLKSQTWNLTIN